METQKGDIVEAVCPRDDCARPHKLLLVPGEVREVACRDCGSAFPMRHPTSQAEAALIAEAERLAAEEHAARPKTDPFAIDFHVLARAWQHLASHISILKRMSPGARRDNRMRNLVQQRKYETAFWLAFNVMRQHRPTDRAPFTPEPTFFAKMSEPKAMLAFTDIVGMYIPKTVGNEDTARRFSDAWTAKLAEPEFREQFWAAYDVLDLYAPHGDAPAQGASA